MLALLVSEIKLLQNMHITNFRMNAYFKIKDDFLKPVFQNGQFSNDHSSQLNTTKLVYLWDQIQPPTRRHTKA